MRKVTVKAVMIGARAALLKMLVTFSQKIAENTMLEVIQKAVHLVTARTYH